MLDALRAKVASRRDRLNEIERERIVLIAEVNAYEDALALVEAELGDSEAAVQGREPHTGERRPRRLSSDWGSLLTTLAQRHPKPFDIDDVLGAPNNNGFKPTRGNVRSQMAAYVTRGVVERVSEGVFRLTPAGFAELGIEMPGGPRENVPTAPESDNEADLLRKAAE